MCQRIEWKPGQTVRETDWSLGIRTEITFMDHPNIFIY